MVTNPIVSVVVPAYNCTKTLAKTIDSVMRQTYQDWELIIVDDCSSDDTNALIQTFTKMDERIVLMKNKSNLGVAETRNNGVDFARGDYIAFLDSDDIWLPEKLERQMELMIETSAVLSCTSYSFIDEDDNELPNSVVVPRNIDIKLLIRKNIIGCSTVVVKKDVAKQHRMLSDFFHEDYVTWLKILKEHEIVYGLSSVYTQYRFMKGSKSHNKIKSGLKLFSVYRKVMGMNSIHSIYRLTSYFFYGLSKYNKLILGK